MPGDANPGRLDAVLLSHLHLDHADLPSLRQLGTSTRVLAPAGSGEWLRAQGMRHVEELRSGEDTSVGPLRVTATGALHDGHRWPFGVRARPIGFVIEGSGSVYFAGDTDLYPAMAHL